MSDSLGTVFVEVHLDKTKFEYQQQKLIDDTQKVANAVEGSLQRSFQNLSVKTDNLYQLAANKAIVSYERIKQAANTTAAEEYRARASMIAKINALNIEKTKNPLFDTLGIQSQAAIEAQKQAVMRSYATAMEYAKKGSIDEINLTAAKNAKLAQMDNELNAVSIANDKSKWDTLGIRATSAIKAEMDMVRKSAADKQAIYAKGSQDWVNIERAKNDKLKSLNKEMVGSHDMSMAAMTRSVLRMYAAWYVASTAVRAIFAPIREGVQYLAAMETAQLGIAASLATAGRFIDQTTQKALEGQAALNEAQKMSKSIVKELEFENIRTIATLDELVKAYQTALPVAMAKGFDIAQVKSFTVAMVQAAGAIGLPFDQMAEEIRSLLTGSINPRNSRIATVLGLRNEDINQFKGNADELFNFLMGKLSAYKEAGIEAQNTWAGLWSNAKDIADQFLGKLSEPLFNEIKAGMQDLLNKTVTLDEKTKTIKWNPEFIGIIDTLKDMVSLLTFVPKVFISAGEGAVDVLKNIDDPMIRINRNIVSARENYEKLKKQFEVQQIPGMPDFGVTIEGIERARIAYETLIANVEKDLKRANEELENFKPKPGPWEEFVGFLANWGWDILSVFSLMGKSVGGMFATMLIDIVTFVSNVAARFLSLGKIIQGAFTFNFDLMNQGWSEIANLPKDIFNDWATTWDSYVLSMGQSWDDFIKEIESRRSQKKEIVGPVATSGFKANEAAAAAEAEARDAAANAAEKHAEKIADVIANLKFEMEMLGLTEDQMFALNKVNEADLKITEEQGKAIYDLATAYRKAAADNEWLEESIKASTEEYRKSKQEIEDLNIELTYLKALSGQIESDIGPFISTDDVKRAKEISEAVKGMTDPSQIAERSKLVGEIFDVKLAQKNADEIKAGQIKTMEDAASKSEEAWTEAAKNIQNAWAGLFSKIARGEISGANDVLKELMYTMSDNAAQNFAAQLTEELESGFSTDIGEFFTTILDDFGLTAGQAVNSLAAVIATAYSAVGMAKKDAALSGAMTGASVGGQAGGGYGAAAGLILGGAGGWLLGSNGPSTGERLADAIDKLIETLQENTTMLADQILKTDELTLAQDAMARSIFSTKLDGMEATLAGAFKIPEGTRERGNDTFDNITGGVISAVGTVFSLQTRGLSMQVANAVNGALRTKDKGYTSYDYDREESSNIISDLIGKIGIPDFITLMKQTSEDGGALIEKLVETGYIVADMPERILKHYSDGDSSKLARNEKVAEAIFTVLVDGIMETAAAIDQMNMASDAFAKTWRDKDLTAKERDVQSWEETMNVFGGDAMQDYLAQVSATRDALLDTSSEALEKMDASELEDHFKNIAALDKVLTDSTGKLAEAEETRLLIEQHYFDALVETTATMAKDIAIATGTMSGMEQAFLSIRETGEKYIDQLIDEGMNKDIATAKGEAYIKTLQKEAFQKQWNADKSSYETRILQAKIDAATALGKTDELQILNQQLINKNREKEVLGLIETYKYGTPAFEAMRDLAKETWAFEDAARNAAAAMAGMWTKDSIATAKAGWISVIGSLGEIVTPKFFLDAIGLGRDSGLEHLLEATSGDEVKADYAELKELWRTGIIKEDQFNSILSEIIDNGAEVAEAISEAADKWKAMNDVGRESSKWYHGYIDEPLSDFAQAVKTAEDELEDFRVRIGEAGSSVASGWEKGGYIEQAVTAAIRNNFLTDLRKEFSEAFSPTQSSYMQEITSITGKANELLSKMEEIALSTEEIAAQTAAINLQKDAAIKSIYDNTNSWLTYAAALDDPSVKMREEDRQRIINDYTQAYTDSLAKQTKEIERIETNAAKAVENLQALGVSSKELADIQAAVAEQLREVHKSLLNDARGLLYDITGDKSILMQQLVDLESDWQKIDTRDYGAQFDLLQEQYNVLTQIRDIQKSQLEETIANYNTLEDMILELQGGSLAPVQSKEFFELRYAQLLADAQSGDGAAVNALTNFVNQYADFMGAYGDTNYKDFTESIIIDLKALQNKITNGASLNDLKSQLETINTTAETGMNTLIDRLNTIIDKMEAYASFNEADYLAANPDVAQAVKDGLFDSGLEHYLEFGQDEGRLPGFATGGSFIAGENGPEIVSIGSGSSARIFNSNETAKIIAEAVGKAIREENKHQYRKGKESPIVKVYVGNKELKDITVETLRTNQEAHYQIKRVANGR